MAGIQLCDDPDFFPPLDDEDLHVLHGRIVVCHPVTEKLNDPEIVGIPLPDSLISMSGRICCRLFIFFSSSDSLPTSSWRKFRSDERSRPGRERFVEDDRNVVERGKVNYAEVFAERSELVMFLHHFGMFAVAVDRRQERKKKAYVRVFMKTCRSATCFIVNVMALIGCDRRTLEMVRKVVRKRATFAFHCC